jgi:hypothetical protein
MNPKFERYHRELGEKKVAAFETLCFHLADKVEKPYTALESATNLSSFTHAQKIVYRVLDGLNGSYDSVGVASALIEAIEGPGVIPGLVEVTGGTGEFYAESRNIYLERGEPFTLDNLIDHCGYGLVEDPEHFFWDVRYRYVIDVPHRDDPFDEETREVTVMFNCFHLTKMGLEFAQQFFPERIEALRKIEDARK